jgi:hypothetical protein
MTEKTRERRIRFYRESFGIGMIRQRTHETCEHTSFTVGYHKADPVRLTCNQCGLRLKRGAWGWYSDTE